MGGCHAVKELCYGSHHFSTRHPPSILLSLFFLLCLTLTFYLCLASFLIFSHCSPYFSMCLYLNILKFPFLNYPTLNLFTAVKL